MMFKYYAKLNIYYVYILLYVEDVKQIIKFDKMQKMYALNSNMAAVGGTHTMRINRILYTTSYMCVEYSRVRPHLLESKTSPDAIKSEWVRISEIKF